MTQQILVPIDGSKHAQKALELAARIAAGSDARLSVIHVLIHGHVPGDLRALSDVAIDEGLEEAPREGFTEASLPRSGADAHVEPAEAPRELLEDIAGKLLERAERTAREHGVDRVETAWCAGDPARAILDQARERGADMIVMGSRGLGDLAGLVTGSVSHKVSHVFDGTVVTVK
mgnify:CR=1 FL=1